MTEPRNPGWSVPTSYSKAKALLLDVVDASEARIVGGERSLTPHQVIALSEATRLAVAKPPYLASALEAEEALRSVRQAGLTRERLFAWFAHAEMPFPEPFYLDLTPVSDPSYSAMACADADGTAVTVGAALISRTGDGQRICTPFGSGVDGVNWGELRGETDGARAFRWALTEAWPDGRIPALAPLGRLRLLDHYKPPAIIPKVALGSPLLEQPWFLLPNRTFDGLPEHLSDLVLVQPWALGMPRVSGLFEIGAADMRSWAFRGDAPNWLDHMLRTWASMVAAQVELVAALMRRFVRQGVDIVNAPDTSPEIQRRVERGDLARPLVVRLRQ